jgi:hypothetical protein
LHGYQSKRNNILYGFNAFLQGLTMARQSQLHGILCPHGNVEAHGKEVAARQSAIRTA